MTDLSKYVKKPEDRKVESDIDGVRVETIYGDLNHMSRFSAINISDGSCLSESGNKYQQIMYVSKGKGRFASGNKGFDLVEDYALLIPARTNYLLTNQDSENLEILVISEESPEKKGEIVVKNLAEEPFDGGETLHWCHKTKTIFGFDKNNLSKLHYVSLVHVEPRKMPEPHTHLPGTDEVWYSLKEETEMALHDDLIKHKPRTAIRIPDDNKTEHTSINSSHDKTAKFFFFLHATELEENRK